MFLCKWIKSLFTKKEYTPEPIEHEEEEKIETVDFSTMTKKELDAWAEDHGIKLDRRMKKDKMIEMLNEALSKKG